MSTFRRGPEHYLPVLGGLTLLVVLVLLCLLPLVMVEVMNSALRKLHIAPSVAPLLVLGIFLGSLVNIPVWRWEREEDQPTAGSGLWGPWGWAPVVHRRRTETLIAINVGGCLIPAAIALVQASYALSDGGRVVLALAIAVGVNVAVCYAVARPVRGVGIAMPGFVSPLVAVGIAWLLLGGDALASSRAAVAFTAGVAGPLVGADLLNLRRLEGTAASIVAIGGAGTFDGIVLSGLLAALLA